MFGAATLGAQQPDTAAAHQDSTSAPVVLAPLVVTSIRPSADAVRSAVPAQITEISGDALDQWEPRHLSGALGTQAGFSAFDELGSPSKLSFVTRGFVAGPVLGVPQGVSVFVDGVRQNEPDAAEVNTDLLPMEEVERIEILHGTGSLLGANSLGGAVNLITRRGGGAAEGGVEVSGGSHGRAGVNGDIQGGGSGPWAFYLGGGAERADGWRAVTGERSGEVFGSLGRGWAGGGLRLQSFGSWSRAETAGSLPEMLYHSAPAGNFTPGDFENLHQWQGSATAHEAFAGGVGSVVLYNRRSDAERFNVNQAPDPDVRSHTANRVTGFVADFRRPWAVAGHVLALRGGIDADLSRVTVHIVNESSADSTLTTAVQSPGGEIAAYTEAEYTVSSVTFSASLRFDHIVVPFRDLLDPSANRDDRFTRLSPRVGARLALGSAASVYTSWGQSFRAPSLIELTCADPTAPCPLPFALGDDPLLPPVTASTFEVGGEITRPRWRLSGALYRTGVQDEIFFIASDAALFAGYFADIGRTRRMGLEADAGWSATSQLSLTAGYAFTNATFQTTADLFSPREDADPSSRWFGSNTVLPGDHLPLIPAHQLQFGVAWQMTPHLNAGGSFRFIGERWMQGDEANLTLPLPAHTVTDLRLGWAAGRWEVNAVLTNLFDARYAAFGTFNQDRRTGAVERFFTPGLPRELRVSVRRGFGV